MRRALVVLAAVAATLIGVVGSSNAGVGSFVHSPQPSTSDSIYRLESTDGNGHAFSPGATNGIGDVWIEGHFELTYWTQPTNGYPWWQYVLTTELEI
jgi:hypothetical protein